MATGAIRRKGKTGCIFGAAGRRRSVGWCTTWQREKEGRGEVNCVGKKGKGKGKKVQGGLWGTLGRAEDPQRAVPSFSPVCPPLKGAV